MMNIPAFHDAVQRSKHGTIASFLPFQTALAFASWGLCLQQIGKRSHEFAAGLFEQYSATDHDLLWWESNVSVTGTDSRKQWITNTK
jgi:hypothetical protein